MNKAELINEVSSAANLSKSDAAKAIDAVMSTITRSLRSGEQVTVVGFGTFLVRNRSARTGRNPRTGETISIPAGRAAGFKAGKALKDALNS
jgi:DNA-binding protein HU-beta